MNTEQKIEREFEDNLDFIVPMLKREQVNGMAKAFMLGHSGSPISTDDMKDLNAHTKDFKEHIDIVFDWN